MDPKLPEKDQARNFYLKTDFTQEQICLLLNINRKTLYGWIREGGWRAARYAASHAPSVLRQQYYSQLGAINRHVAGRAEQPWPTREESETIRRLVMSVNQMDSGTPSLTETIQVFEGFISKIKKKDPELMKQVIRHMDNYVQGLAAQGRLLDYAQYMREEEEFDKEYEQWLTEEQKQVAQLSGDQATATPASSSDAVAPSAPLTTSGKPGEETPPAASSAAPSDDPPGGDPIDGNNGVSNRVSPSGETPTEPIPGDDSN